MTNAINTAAAEALRAKQEAIAAQQREIEEQIKALTAAAVDTAKVAISEKAAEFKAALTAEFAPVLSESELMQAIKAALFGATTAAATGTKRPRVTEEVKALAQIAFDRGVPVAEIARRTGWTCSVYFAGKEPAQKIVVDGWETGKKGKVPEAAQVVIAEILDEVFGVDSTLEDLEEVTDVQPAVNGQTAKPEVSDDSVLDTLEEAPM